MFCLLVDEQLLHHHHHHHLHHHAAHLHPSMAGVGDVATSDLNSTSDHDDSKALDLLSDVDDDDVEHDDDDDSDLCESPALFYRVFF